MPSRTQKLEQPTFTCVACSRDWLRVWVLRKGKRIVGSTYWYPKFWTMSGHTLGHWSPQRRQLPANSKQIFHTRNRRHSRSFNSDLAVAPSTGVGRALGSGAHRARGRGRRYRRKEERILGQSKCLSVSFIASLRNLCGYWFALKHDHDDHYFTQSQRRYAKKEESQCHSRLLSSNQAWHIALSLLTHTELDR